MHASVIRLEFQIELPVFPCGVFPGDVLFHIPDDHLIPALTVGEVQRFGAVDCVEEQPGSCWNMNCQQLIPEGDPFSIYLVNEHFYLLKRRTSLESRLVLDKSDVFTF